MPLHQQHIAVRNMWDRTPERPEIIIRHGYPNGNGPRWYVNNTPCSTALDALRLVTECVASVEHECERGRFNPTTEAA